MSYPSDFAGDLNSVEDLINSADSSMKTEIDWESQRPYPSSAVEHWREDPIYPDVYLTHSTEMVLL